MSRCLSTVHGRPASRELRSALMRHASSKSGVTLDLAKVTNVGNEFLALLAVSKGWFESRGGFSVVNASAEISRVFHRRLVEYLLE